ncbi:LuxR family transcriptional regulator [Glycomyces fuscus]|nr:LuxR family transcriptional regulator [Glycomyces fuscus]
MTDMPLLSRTSPLLVGRQDQLRLLCEHARRCRAETSGTVLLGGDAGVGKSRLVGEFTADLPEGTVFVGGCLELGVDGLAYAPFTAILRQLLRERGRAVFEEAASGGTGELARLLPELGPLPGGRGEHRGVLFEQVLRLVQRAAGDRGLTLVLEDLHWSDCATRDLLVFLVRNLDLPGVQVIATYRSDDLHRAHPLRLLLPELERLPAVTRLDLRPLSREEVGRQAHAITGAALTAERLDDLYRRSDGIPLYVEALTDSGSGLPAAEDVPDHFRDLLLAPVHRLDPQSVSVLRVASVGAVSGEIGHRPLEHASELPEDALEAALHTLVDARLLRVSGDGYRFRHALLREAVHDSLLPGAHSRLHLRFAQLIDDLPDAFPAERRAAEQAHHYQAAQDLPRALQAAWSAARRAGETLAHGERLAMLERVLALWDRVPDAVERTGGRTRPEVLAEAALSALQAGRPRQAWGLCDEGLAAVPEAPGDDRAMTVRAVLFRCRGQARTHCVDEGAGDDLAEALRLHPPGMPGYGRMLSILARETMFRPGERTPLDRSAEELAQEAVEVARSTGDRSAEAAALVTLGSLHMGRGDLERGRPVVERAVELSREVGDTAMEARGVNNLAHYLREQGRHHESLESMERFLAGHRSGGTGSVHRSFLYQNIAEAHFELGHLARAREVAHEALGRSPTPMHRVFLLVPGSRAALAQGDLAAARSGTAHDDLAGTREGIDRVDRMSVLSMERLDQAQQAATAWLDLLLAEGDTDGARAYAGEVLARLAFSGSPGYGWSLLDLAAEAVRRSAAPEEDPLRVRVGATAERFPVLGPVQEAMRASCRARLAEGTASAEHVRRAWEEAVERWEDTPMRLYRAGARLRAAHAALAVRDQAAARERLERAHGAARECGAVPLERAAADLARRAGVRLGGADGPPPAVPAGLTPRELEVARLLAVGGTNAQIAERLFITPKTASVHVSNILAKLGVPNRAAAGARARDLGLA